MLAGKALWPMWTLHAVTWLEFQLELFLGMFSSCRLKWVFPLPSELIFDLLQQKINQAAREKLRALFEMFPTNGVLEYSYESCSSLMWLNNIDLKEPSLNYFNSTKFDLLTVYEILSV